MRTGDVSKMSKLPFANSSQLDKSYEDSGAGGEASGSNGHEALHEGTDIDVNSLDDQDELNETGDIGVGQQVYASYQKSGHKPLKGKDQLKMADTLEDEDFVNINSSLKSTRQRPAAYMWLRHPKVRENWKTVAGAIFLLTVGILFLICGIVLAAIPDHDGPKAIIFFVCAAVCILPGGYHTIYIYRATKGWRGYTFESLPSFR